MPTNPKLMGSLKDRYGKEKGKSVYYAMENKCKTAKKKGKKRPGYCDPIEKAIRGGS